jgi:glycerol kinase
VEATTLGAARLAAVAGGLWPSVGDLADEWRPIEVIEPRTSAIRDRWSDAIERSREWIPGLSALDF